MSMLNKRSKVGWIRCLQNKLGLSGRVIQLTLDATTITRMVSLLVVAICVFLNRSASGQTNDLSGTNDTSIRSILDRVARHQINFCGVLQDGDYTNTQSIMVA